VSLSLPQGFLFSACSAGLKASGRPDLAMEALDQVRAPTLLIVGGRDAAVIEMNRAAQAHLRAESQLVIVPGATHLFEEPGALDEVIRLARDWFLRGFGDGAGPSASEHRPPAGPG